MLKLFRELLIKKWYKKVRVYMNSDYINISQ
jgi:hypothetical protein